MLLCSPFQFSTSAPLLRPPLGFLYCFCCSPTLGVSTPTPVFFFLWLFRGLFSVIGCFGSYGSGCYSAFVSSFTALLSSVLHFVCSVSSYPLHFYASSLPGCFFQSSSAFFRWLILRLLLPVFLLVFFGLLWLWLLLPFFLGVSAGYGCGCSLRFVVRLLLPCLLRVFRVSFLSIPVLRFPALLLCLRVWTFTGFFPFSSLWFLGLRVLPLCPLFLVLVGGFLCSGFGAVSPGVPFLFLSVSIAFCGDSASFGSPVPFAMWSPFGTSQVLLRPLFLSSGWLLVIFSFS